MEFTSSIYLQFIFKYDAYTQPQRMLITQQQYIPVSFMFILWAGRLHGWPVEKVRVIQAVGWVGRGGLGGQVGGSSVVGVAALRASIMHTTAIWRPGRHATSTSSRESLVSRLAVVTFKCKSCPDLSIILMA